MILEDEALDVDDNKVCRASFVGRQQTTATKTRGNKKWKKMMSAAANGRKISFVFGKTRSAAADERIFGVAGRVAASRPPAAASVAANRAHRSLTHIARSRINFCFCGVFWGGREKNAMAGRNARRYWSQGRVSADLDGFGT